MDRSLEKKARVIAFYLPQFHPIPENDSFWGKGFTEWTNVTKAKPLFNGHRQPKLPGELGYYDLRVPEVREQQAALAKEAGIEGFCYWHYWFGNGRRTLDRVFTEVVKSGKPDFPFCLAWANESWTGRWHGLNNEIIAEQTYPGEEDFRNHFFEILPALKDKRYIKVNGRPVFVIYRPTDLPDPVLFTTCWNKLAEQNNLNKFYFIGVTDDSLPQEYGFEKRMRSALAGGVPKIKKTFLQKISGTKTPELLYEYKDLIKERIERGNDDDEIPCVIPNWDNTPRSGYNGRVFLNESPKLYQQWLEKMIQDSQVKEFDERLVFLKSWNEWAEGNYLEPDEQWGRQYLDATRKAIFGPE